MLSRLACRSLGRLSNGFIFSYIPDFGDLIRGVDIFIRPASVVEVGVLSLALPAPGGEVIRRCSALQVVLIFIPIVLCFYH